MKLDNLNKLSILLLLTTAVDATIYDLTLDLDCPCNWIPLSTRFPAEILNLHFNAQLVIPCREEYHRHVTYWFEQLNNCAPRKQKRSILDLVAKVVGFSINTLLQTKFSSVKESDVTDDSFLKTLIDPVVDKTKSMLRDANEDNPVVLREIREVSSSADNHIKELHEAVANSMFTCIGVCRIMQAILATRATLHKIVNECKLGHIATTELADLMSYPDIANINPKETLILSVYANIDANRVRFRFVHLEESAHEKRILITTTSLTLLILSIISIILYLIVKKYYNKINQRNQEIELDMNED